MPRSAPNLHPFHKIELSFSDQKRNLLGDDSSASVGCGEERTTSYALNSTSQKYTEEADEQSYRLKSIHLLDQHGNIFCHDKKKCPLCSAQLNDAIPRIEALYDVLNKLDQDLQFIKKNERPKLGEYIKRLENDRSELNSKIKEKKSTLNNYMKERNTFLQVSKKDQEKIELIGAIKNYLEDITLPDRTASLSGKEEKLKKDIHFLESQLNEDKIDEIKQSTVAWLSEPMKIWAEKLQLEDSGSSYRFDFENLIVIADRKGYPVTMPNMRGHSEWIGCHLIALLALHQAFSGRKSHLPNFLVLDQPSQGYQKADIGAVKRMFELLSAISKELNLQVIVMEHVQPEEEFTHALVEPYWTKNSALIPQDWKN